jgi:hypothetical protein
MNLDCSVLEATFFARLPKDFPFGGLTPRKLPAVQAATFRFNAFFAHQALLLYYIST